MTDNAPVSPNAPAAAGAASATAHPWQQDADTSIARYDEWYLKTAPKAFQRLYAEALTHVNRAMATSGGFVSLATRMLWSLPVARLCTAPPLSRTELARLSGVSTELVARIEDDRPLPDDYDAALAQAQRERITQVIHRLADARILPWLAEQRMPSPKENDRAVPLLAERYCARQWAETLRVSQQGRQVAAIGAWLEAHGYQNTLDLPGRDVTFQTLAPGTFAVDLAVPGQHDDGSPVTHVIDVVVRRKDAPATELPLLLAATTAADFAAAARQRGAAVALRAQLGAVHGSRLQLVSVLFGAFDADYLAHQTLKHLPWVWEHRLDELAKLHL